LCLEFDTHLFNENEDSVLPLISLTSIIFIFVFIIYLGRDPLSGLNHWKDINAVAGVFRVYFREMSEPLFPYEFNNDYLRTTST